MVVSILSRGMGRQVWREIKPPVFQLVLRRQRGWGRLSLGEVTLVTHTFVLQRLLEGVFLTERCFLLKSAYQAPLVPANS